MLTPSLWLALIAALNLSVASAPRQPRAAAAPSRLRIDSARFLDASRRPFEWRGITAFRLVERVAHGDDQQAIAYLDWCATNRLTVVRVLTMAQHLFQLKPDEGLKSLPRVLQLAAARGIYVEIVALADTADIKVDIETHVRAIGPIAAAHANALVEIANEPAHPTQDKRLHDPSFVRKLAGLIPSEVPVSLGSVEYGDDYAAGSYATWHSPRSNAQQGWGHVLELRQGAALITRLQKPVISDEPIGAAEQFIAGRRDNEPKRFAAAAALTRISGLGATFHYEGGLQARIPAGRELECFMAWKRALDALAGLPDGGQLGVGPVNVAEVSDAGASLVVSRVFEREAWIVALAPKLGWKPIWNAGWRQEHAVVRDGVSVFRGHRRP